LYLVVGAYRRADGSLIVANSGSNSIRAFDADGTELWESGREGAGPGEFRRIEWITPLPGDTTAVWDINLHRVTLIGPNGAVAAVIELPAGAPIEVDGDSFPAIPRSAHALAGGRFVAEPALFSGVIRGGDGVRQDTLPLWLFDRAGNLVESAGPVAGIEHLRHQRRGMQMPFGRRLHLAVNADEIFAGDGKGDIAVYDAGGAHVRTLTVPVTARAVGDEEVTDVKRRAVEMMVERGRPAMEEMMDFMPVPDSHPRYRGILAGRAGRLWLVLNAAPEDSVQELIALSENGAITHRVALLPSDEVLSISDSHVVVLRRDSLDAEHVVVHALEAR
jgi:hypothetical protein